MVNSKNTYRQLIKYSDKEKYIYEKHKEIINNYIQIMPNNEFFTNQILCSIELLVKLLDRKNVLIMVCGQTQSGKTGTMLKIIQDYMTHPMNLIPMENIYIISGISSKSWENQTKNRIPKPLQDNVYHRNKMKNFKENIEGKSNLLIIIDEVQIASKEGNSLQKIFDELGFYTLDNLLRKDIKIIQFSATPDGLLFNLNQWQNHSDIIVMKPGKQYKSSFQLLKENRILQFKNLISTNKKGTKVIDQKIIKENFNEIKNILIISKNHIISLE